MRIVAYGESMGSEAMYAIAREYLATEQLRPMSRHVLSALSHWSRSMRQVSTVPEATTARGDLMDRGSGCLRRDGCV